VPVLQRQLFADPPEVLVVDLSDVEFMSATAVGALLRADERARRERHRFGVVASTRAVSRLLGLLHAGADLAVFPTLSDAVRELPAQRPYAPSQPARWTQR
jgi:anti-anti-sigma factor